MWGIFFLKNEMFPKKSPKWQNIGMTKGAKMEILA